jgi:oxalate decarboxylase/phosphoglucose isomerase-like protein (cupin superfamily)
VLHGVTTFGKPGAHVLVPKGHAHSFWNAGARPGKLLLIVSPPGLEHYFRDLAAGLGDIATQEASIPLRKQLSEKHDIEVVGEAVPSPRRGEG